MDSLISRQAAIDAARQYCIENQIEDGDYHANGIEYELSNLPSAQPEITRENILGWLLAYHTQSFELKARYQAHEVIGWLIHDISINLLGKSILGGEQE